MGGDYLKGGFPFGGVTFLILRSKDEFFIYKKLEWKVLEYSTVPSPSILLYGNAPEGSTTFHHIPQPSTGFHQVP